jgi:hypothetical protein
MTAKIWDFISPISMLNGSHERVVSLVPPPYVHNTIIRESKDFSEQL